MTNVILRGRTGQVSRIRQPAEVPFSLLVVFFATPPTTFQHSAEYWNVVNPVKNGVSNGVNTPGGLPFLSSLFPERSRRNFKAKPNGGGFYFNTPPGLPFCSFQFNTPPGWRIGKA
jgi:hypothetical protein